MAAPLSSFGRVYCRPIQCVGPPAKVAIFAEKHLARAERGRGLAKTRFLENKRSLRTRITEPDLVSVVEDCQWRSCQG
jgi:hypothetical protein